jgi:predicted nucleic acid-binding Zn ribbon protein
MQKITAPALETCPECGEPGPKADQQKRCYYFKGSGFYATDAKTKEYARS